MHRPITIKPFSALSTQELYAILRLRQEVFIVEQRCFYLDADGKDQASLHLLAHDKEGNLSACLRILPPGLAYDTAGIGRMAVAPSARGAGLGIALMREALAVIAERHGGGVTLTAQTRAGPFYEKLGFTVQGAPFDEAGTPHVTMMGC